MTTAMGFCPAVRLLVLFWWRLMSSSRLGLNIPRIQLL
uniref:Uncharacterized protein n=1 Tax=Anguilla anguilla TaxID=7936 RepID=A0A0E9QTJ3_ANGAN